MEAADMGSMPSVEFLSLQTDEQRHSPWTPDFSISVFVQLAEQK